MAARAGQTARIYVLAGTNGAGKSSLTGATFREHGIETFDPDEVARRLRSTDRTISQDQANADAWQHGRRLLERAIADVWISRSRPR